MTEDVKTKAELEKGAAADSGLLEGLSDLILTPVSLRKIFILLTRVHYSDSEHYGELKPQFEKFIWSKEETKRTLHIDFDYNFDPAKVDRRPALFVGTSDFTFTQKVIDNMHSQTEDRAGTQYVMMTAVDVIIRHIGKTPDEALALGDMTCQFFNGMRKMLQERMKFSQVNVGKLMTSRPFDRSSNQADQQFMVDLLINLQYNSAWLTFREGHRIKTAKFEQLAAYSLPLDDQNTAHQRLAQNETTR